MPATSTSKEYWPFVKAESYADCELLWIGVPAFPMPSAHRAWLIEFILRFTQAAQTGIAVRGEFFLEFKTVIELERTFRRLVIETAPWAGLSRRPNTVPPGAPDRKRLEDISKGAPYDVKEFFPDSCFWLRGDLAKLLGEFFGYGGGSMFYLPPDPAAAPPKIPYMDELKLTFPQIDFAKLNHITNVTSGLREKFLTESKNLFGAGLEQEPSWEGISFILPLLETSDFFTQPEAERKKWFQLFDLFWRESPADKGLYLASKKPLLELLRPVVNEMMEAGHFHPDYRRSQ